MVMRAVEISEFLKDKRLTMLENKVDLTRMTLLKLRDHPESNFSESTLSKMENFIKKY